MEFLALDNGVLERIVSLLCFDAMSPLTLTTGFFLFAFLVFGVGYAIPSLYQAHKNHAGETADDYKVKSFTFSKAEPRTDQ